MKNGKVVFIRHANFFKPVNNAYYGQSNLPLTPGGELQARNLAKLLPLQETGIGAVYSSDLERARHTAEIAFPAYDILTLNGLREMSFGDWEGKTYDEIKDVPEFDDFTKGSAAPGGESTLEFSQRVKNSLEEILDECEGGVAVVAHAGPIRLMIAHMLCMDDSQCWRFSVDTASISTVTVADGYAYLSALNVKPTLFLTK